jgi:hypothetical protein
MPLWRKSMPMTPEEIKERLRANGNPSVFEEQVLKYIEKLERERTSLSKSLAQKLNHDE